MANKFTTLNATQLRNTLARKLIGPVDAIRNIATVLGGRQYIVRIVRVHWSGFIRGEGVSTVLSTTPILPTPKVEAVEDMNEVVNAVGLDEAGELKVTQISGRFTENDLRAYDSDGTPPGDADEVFYEIEFPQPDNQPGLKRRYSLNRAPDYKGNGTSCQWVIHLSRAHDDRPRTDPPR